VDFSYAVVRLITGDKISLQGTVLLRFNPNHDNKILNNDRNATGWVVSPFLSIPPLIPSGAPILQSRCYPIHPFGAC
jgi:hypothetical protein